MSVDTSKMITSITLNDVEVPLKLKEVETCTVTLSVSGSYNMKPKITYVALVDGEVIKQSVTCSSSYNYYTQQFTNVVRNTAIYLENAGSAQLSYYSVSSSYTLNGNKQYYYTSSYDDNTETYKYTALAGVWAYGWFFIGEGAYIYINNG